MSKNTIILTVLLVILMIVTISQTVVAQPHGSGGGSEETTETITYSDYCSVGATWDTTIDNEFSDKSIKNIVFELTWTDDEGSDSDPDTLSLQTDDAEHDAKSGQSSSGTVAVTWDEPDLNNIWNIVVACDSAGPTQEPYWRVGVITQDVPDPGNSWTLKVTYTYTEDSGSMGGMPANVAAVYSSPIFWIHVALMIASTYLFLSTFIFAGIFLYARTRWNDSNSKFQRYLAKPNLTFISVILAFVAFFLASVPIGMWVAGMMYGWTKAWTGIPAIWNPEAFDFRNADNVSFAVLFLWAIPAFLNRRQFMQTKWYRRFFGWSKWAMAHADRAPEPKLMMREIALCYFFMGFLVYLVFMVQPHGSG
jgi:hypothetical protein